MGLKLTILFYLLYYSFEFCIVNYTPLFKKLNFDLKTTSLVTTDVMCVNCRPPLLFHYIVHQFVAELCGVLCCGWPNVYPLVGEPQIY